MARALLFLAGLCSVLDLFAFQVTGVVSSVEGPLAYVAIYEKGTTYGVVSNVKGAYFMELPAGKHVLVFETLGHAIAEHEILVTDNMTLDVQLDAVHEMLQAVVVDKNREDPAYAIIRRAIAVREGVNANLNTFKSKMYIKASLEVEDLEHPDTTNNQFITKKRVNLIESYSNVYFLKPNIFKEEKLGFRDLAQKSSQTESVSISVGAGGGSVQTIEVINPRLFFTRLNDGDFNFYQNHLFLPSLSERPFVSPIADNAINVYTFRLVESFNNAEGALVYKIKVAPRKETANGFEGVLFLLDSSFTIEAVELSLNATSIPQFDHFSLVQNYSRNSEGMLLIQRQEFYYQSKINKNATNFGQTVVHFSEYEVNVPLNGRFMRNGTIVYDKESYERSNDFWDDIRPITLKQIESEFIHVQDSINTYQKSVEYLNQRDSIFNDLGVWNFLLTGIHHRNSSKGLTLFAYPLIQQIKINTVDGYRHTLGGVITKEWERGTELTTSGGISYGIINENIRGDLEAKFKYDPFKFGSARMKYTHVYTMINTTESIRATFSPSNYSDNVGYGIGHEMEWFNGFFLKTYLDYNLYKPYRGKTVENFWKNFPLFSEPKDFEPFEELVLNLSARITFAQLYELRPNRKVIIGSKYPIINIQYSKGIKPWLKSDVNYDRLQIDAQKTYRVGTIGVSKLKFLAGRFINDREVRIANLKYFRGSDPYYFSDPLSTFQLIGPLSLSTSKTYIQGHYVHHFNGAVLGKMRFFNRHSIQLAVGGSTLYLEENKMKHLEVYAGLEKPFTIQHQLFRFGVYYVNAVTSGMGFSHGVKIGFDFYNGYNHEWQY